VTTEAAEVDSLNGRAAGFVTRLMAYLLDALVLTIILAGGAWLFVQVDALLGELTLSDNIRISATTLWALMVPVIIVFYYVMFWSLTGQTLGKMVLGLRIVGRDGKPPGIGRSFIRLIGYLLSMLALWMGYLWIIVDDQRKGWHDHMASTWVVYDFARKKKGDAYEMTISREHNPETPTGAE